MMAVKGLLVCAAVAGALRPPVHHGGRLPASKPRRSIALRGGALPLPVAPLAARLGASPASLFNAVFGGLAASAVAAKAASRGEAAGAESAATRAVKLRFLPVFWLLRMADWLQGPYFYEVYASKAFGGKPASLELVSRLFLAGFGATAVAGPYVGRAADRRGRKRGTLAFAALYAAGALSTRSPVLAVLVLGRLLSGVGTSLLFSAPEAWLVGDAAAAGCADDLGAVFGAAYAGDALVAIAAGQLAALAASARGPCGPFDLSVGFLAAGAAAAALLWKENRADVKSGEAAPTIRDAVRVATGDRKILRVGAVQALFEGAMSGRPRPPFLPSGPERPPRRDDRPEPTPARYIFVLQWPPALSAAIAATFGADAAVPFGKVFSCFMVCCLLGSTAFQGAREKMAAETSTATMLAAATGAMALAAATTARGAALAPLVAAFFAFELCVGFYFPSIGTLRSKYVPDSHRSVIMNLFGIPLNALVVGCFLSIKKLGVSGALGVATTALGLATLAAADLARLTSKKEKPAPGDEKALPA